MVSVLTLVSRLSALAQPSIITDHFSYLPGEPIAATWQGGPGNPKDWVGVYPQGVVPGSVGSTIWLYTDGTTAGAKGYAEGSVTFASGLSLAGPWTAFLLANDGYSILAQIDLQVIDPTQPFVRPDKRVYLVGDPISVVFTNGPGNAKDWIGIYPESRQPGNGSSLLWNYVNGTHTATTGQTEGAVSFPSGLKTNGSFVAYLLLDDGYTIIASEPFSVVQPVSAYPRLVSISPINNASNVAPFVDFSALIKDSTFRLATNTVTLALDGAKVPHSLTQQSNQTTISYSSPAPQVPNSAHTLVLRFADNATPANWYTNTVAFTIVAYNNLLLPAPIYFENFDSTPEGSLPNGWTSTSYSDVPDDNLDLQDLNSKSYANWVVVSRDRFTNSFLSYNSHTPTDDYQRVLSVNPLNVVNSRPVHDLASGNFVFGDSGYRSGGNQYLILQTPDFDLRGKSNVYLSFHSLWEQNQDSIGSVEYSIDRGTNWLPLVCMLDRPDVYTNDTGGIDAVLTLTTSHSDVAVYTDPVSGQQMGGYYGAFIGAPVGPELAPYISPRVDDNPVESKRVEVFRLTQADNQPAVRFRFAHAGTDSWYFGVDDFGLYSIPAVLAVSRQGNNVFISWPVPMPGYQLESTDSLANPHWTSVGDLGGNSFTEPVTAGAKYYRLRK